MKYFGTLAVALTAVLFYQCDPVNKVYQGPEYQGAIDTVNNN